MISNIYLEVAEENLEERLKKLRQKAIKLPFEPGVYIMKNESGKIIYIGKAKALRNRVSSYFGSQKNHMSKVKKMVSNVTNFDYIITDSEFEALVLECSLIKQYLPKYNILLKDDKGYSYIKVTNEKYRRIFACKQKEKDDATYIGPYTSAWSLNEAIEQVQRIFRLPNCNKVLSESQKKSRPCLNYYINLCSAPCCNKISREEYNKNIDEAIKYLKKGDIKSKKELKSQMEQAAANLEFEKAAKIRDRLSAIEKINEKQKIIIGANVTQDVISIATGKEKMCIFVLRFKEGKLCAKDVFFENSVNDEKETMTEFIKRYYTLHEDIPNFIVLNDEINDRHIIQQWLKSKAQKKIEFKIPTKGNRFELVKMCKKNAYEALAKREGRYNSTENQELSELKKALNLTKIPEYIESYDISNTGNDSVVGAMVVFKNAKPLKSAYRKFKIRYVSSQDDYASMREVLKRRFEEYEKAEEKTEGFGRLPDLILLDGGKGHILSCAQIIQKYNIPCFGMVKDSKHRSRAIASYDAEINFNRLSPAMNLITRIQNEVHRFAINYHRTLRDKSRLSLTLTKIPGIGENRAKELIKHFRSLENIKQAKEDELLKVKLINRKIAENIIEFYKNI